MERKASVFKETSAGYSLKCHGPLDFLNVINTKMEPNKIDLSRLPLSDNPVEISVVVFKDGTRQIGCPFLLTYNTGLTVCVAGAEDIRNEYKNCHHFAPNTNFRPF